MRRSYRVLLLLLPMGILGVLLACFVPGEARPVSLMENATVVASFPTAKTGVKGLDENWHDWRDNDHILISIDGNDMREVDIRTKAVTKVMGVPPFVHSVPWRNSHLRVLLSPDKRQLLRVGDAIEKGKYVRVVEVVSLKSSKDAPRVVSWQGEHFQEVVWMPDSTQWVNWNLWDKDTMLHNLRDPKSKSLYCRSMTAKLDKSIAMLGIAPASLLRLTIRGGTDHLAMERVTPTIGAWKTEVIATETISTMNETIYPMDSAAEKILWYVLAEPEPPSLRPLFNLLERWKLRKRPEYREFLAISDVSHPEAYRRVAVLPDVGARIVARLSPDGKQIAFNLANRIWIFPHTPLKENPMRRRVPILAFLFTLLAGIVLAFVIPLGIEPPPIPQNARVVKEFADSTFTDRGSAGWYDWLDNGHVIYRHPTMGYRVLDLHARTEMPLAPLPPFVPPKGGSTGNVTGQSLSHDKQWLLRSGERTASGSAKTYWVQAVRLQNVPNEPRVVEWQTKEPTREIIWLLDSVHWVNWDTDSGSDILTTRNVQNAKEIYTKRYPLATGYNTDAMTEIPPDALIRASRKSFNTPTRLERILPLSGEIKTEIIPSPSRRVASPTYASSGGELVWMEDVYPAPDPPYMVWINGFLERMRFRARPRPRYYLAVSDGDTGQYRRVARFPTPARYIGIPRLSPDSRNLLFYLDDAMRVLDVSR